MENSFDSTDRSAGELLLFAVAFFGFLLAAGGIVVDSAGTAISGGLLTFLAITFLGLMAGPD